MHEAPERLPAGVLEAPEKPGFPVDDRHATAMARRQRRHRGDRVRCGIDPAYGARTNVAAEAAQPDVVGELARETTVVLALGLDRGLGGAGGRVHALDPRGSAGDEPQVIEA